MSNRTLVAIVAGLVVLLALPLIPQAVEALRGQHANDAPRNAVMATNAAEAAPPVEEETVEEVPAADMLLQLAFRRPSVMTETQLRQIRSGMTYEQCVAFIGSEGEPAGREPDGSQVYRWQLVSDPPSTVGIGEATLTFRNGICCGQGFNRNQGRRVSGPMNMSAALPAQRPAAPPYICRSVNKGMKNGCTYEECVRLLGMEGIYQGSSAMSGGSFAADGTPVPAIADVYSWHNPAIPATLTLSFRDGKLTARQVAVGSIATGGYGGSR